MKRTALAICAVLSLAACDKPKPPDIIQPQREALEKAKGVEQILQQDAEATRKQIEEAEGR